MNIVSITGIEIKHHVFALPFGIYACHTESLPGADIRTQLIDKATETTKYIQNIWCELKGVPFAPHFVSSPSREIGPDLYICKAEMAQQEIQFWVSWENNPMPSLL